jgi:hypothetical protein
VAFKDWFKRGEKLVVDNKDAVEQGIDHVGDMIDDKTDGKYSDQVDQGQEQAKEWVEDLDNDG